MIHKSTQPPIAPKTTSIPSFSSKVSMDSVPECRAYGSGFLRFLASRKFPAHKLRFFRALHHVLTEAGSVLMLKKNRDIVIYHPATQTEVGKITTLTLNEKGTYPIHVDSASLMLSPQKSLQKLDLLIAGASAVPPGINWERDFLNIDRYAIAIDPSEPSTLVVSLYIGDDAIHSRMHRLFLTCGAPKRKPGTTL